jgi:hypothetical protein
MARKKVDEVNRELVDDLVEEADTSSIVETLPPTQTKIDPRPGDDDWEEFVLSRLTPKEVDKNGYPKTAGLRRIAPGLLGRFIRNGPDRVVEPCEANNHRSTVIYLIEYLDKHAQLDEREESDPYLNYEHRRVVVTEAADAWQHNIDGDDFAKFPVAIAATRAEGRALRKALMLSVVVAEELSEKPLVPTELPPSVGLITSAQINGIDSMCRKLDINVLNFIAPGKFTNINDVPQATAKRMMSALHHYKDGVDDKGQPKPIPDKIKGYDENWRN